jgi:hypothetical protein
MHIQLVPGGPNAFQVVHFAAFQYILPTRHQLNAHVRPEETKMAVGRENDE